MKSLAMVVVTVRVPRELLDALETEAQRNREPISRTMRRKLQDHEGWVQREDGTWDQVTEWSR